MPVTITSPNVGAEHANLLPALRAVRLVSECVSRVEGGQLLVDLPELDTITPAEQQAFENALAAIVPPAPGPDRTPYTIGELKAAIDARFPAMSFDQRRLLYYLARAAVRSGVGRTEEPL